MTQIVSLLAGVLLAAMIFAALLWSLVQAVRLTGAARMAHGGCVALTIVAMAALSLAWPLAAKLAALPLALSAGWAAWLERGLNRVFPLVLFVLALALLAGRPFGS